MKVLIATLLRRTDTTVFQYPRATESILNIRWQNGTQIDHFMPSGGDEGCISSISRKYEDARRIALERNYDALLTVESDMVVPPDALERLSAVETDVAYGLYALRTGAHHWNIATHVDRFEIVPMSANPLDAKARWGMIVECDGLRLGCTLIRRHVRENRLSIFQRGAYRSPVCCRCEHSRVYASGGYKCYLRAYRWDTSGLPNQRGVLMAYATVAELKAYLSVSGSGDDSLLAALLTRAQAIIDAHCRRTFEAASDSTRYFDAEDDVDGDDLVVDADLYSVTSVTNGDGAAIASTEYVLKPANHRPAYAICLKDTSSVVWTWSDYHENAISVTGRWAYSLTAPADITHACIRLAAWLYRQKDSSADVDAVNVTSGGAVITPSGLPTDVTHLLRTYVR